MLIGSQAQPSLWDFYRNAYATQKKSETNTVAAIIAAGGMAPPPFFDSRDDPLVRRSPNSWGLGAIPYYRGCGREFKCGF